MTQEVYDEDFFLNVKYEPIYGSTGIGSYEFWGSVEYHHGTKYIDEIKWNEWDYTDFENELIYEYVRDNFDVIAKWF